MEILHFTSTVVMDTRGKNSDFRKNIQDNHLKLNIFIYTLFI